MTSELQQALLDDDLPVVQRKVVLGSYPHSVYDRALNANAWACAQWIIHQYPLSISSWDWRNLARNEQFFVDHDVVRLAHTHGLAQKTDSYWRESAIEWEWAGVVFPPSFYDALWKTPELPSKTARQLLALGKINRFEPIEIWLAKDTPPSDKEIMDVFKQLWAHALLYCDKALLAWLRPRTALADVMAHVYKCINARGLVLPTVFAMRANCAERVEWSMNIFLNTALAGLAMTPDEFCQYVALYDAPKLKHVWSKMEPSVCISPAWRSFLASGATLPVPGDNEQRLAMILRGLFPKEEAARMQQCYEARDAQSLPQADLVDLL